MLAVLTVLRIWIGSYQLL